MNKYSWKFWIKLVGILLCIITFITLAVVIYLNRLNPLELDQAVRDFCYKIRGENMALGIGFLE